MFASSNNNLGAHSVRPFQMKLPEPSERVGRSSILALLGSGRVHSVRVGGRGTGSAR